MSWWPWIKPQLQNLRRLVRLHPDSHRRQDFLRRKQHARLQCCWRNLFSQQSPSCINLGSHVSPSSNSVGWFSNVSEWTRSSRSKRPSYLVTGQLDSGQPWGGCTKSQLCFLQHICSHHHQQRMALLCLLDEGPLQNKRGLEELCLGIHCRLHTARRQKRSPRYNVRSRCSCDQW